MPSVISLKGQHSKIHGSFRHNIARRLSLIHAHFMKKFNLVRTEVVSTSKLKVEENDGIETFMSGCEGTVTLQELQISNFC